MLSYFESYRPSCKPYENEARRDGSGAVLKDAINNGDCCSRCSSSVPQTDMVSDQSYNPSQGVKAH